MCDFWDTVLFRAGLYQGNTLQAHQRVHHRIALSANHFLRWLTLWNTTIDQMYQGPTAEHAKIQAARIAASMHRRLTGNNAPELDERAGTTARSHDRRSHDNDTRTTAPPGGMS